MRYDRAARRCKEDVDIAIKTPTEALQAALCDKDDKLCMADLFPAPDVPRLSVEGGSGLFPIRRIFCVGRNYAAHAAEMGAEVERDAPFYFLKGHHSVVASGGEVPFAPGTDAYHFEFELVVALGAPGFRVSKDSAEDLIFGYGAGLDMTRRDLQQANRNKGLPWDVGKDVEAACVLTPLVPDFTLASQRISLTQNGEIRQDATLSDLIWSVQEIIAHLSTLYHLAPGDIIMTGTPAGVGPVEPGDVLEGTIEGLPKLTATMGPRP